MLFAFFGLGVQETILLLLIGCMFLVPALIALAIVVFVATPWTRTHTAIIRNCVRAMAAVGIWVAVGFVLWGIWSRFANDWWTLIAYFAVGAIAGILTVKLWPATGASGRTPDGSDQAHPRPGG